MKIELSKYNHNISHIDLHKLFSVLKCKLKEVTLHTDYRVRKILEQFDEI